MASREAEAGFFKRHPQISAAVALTLITVGVGVYRLDRAGINPFEADPNRPTTEPMFPGTALPRQNTYFKDGYESGCETVQEQETPAQLMVRIGEQIESGQKVVVKYTATGHGGGQATFPAESLDDLNKISKVIWAGDKFCPSSSGQIQVENGVITTKANMQESDNCITAQAGDTAAGIFASVNEVPDGVKDEMSINGTVYPVKTSTDLKNLPRFISIGFRLCPQ